MSATLSIEVSDEFIERVCVDLAVVTFFDTDRPLRGNAGRADWRLCGRISRLLLAGRLEGAAGEALLVPADGGLAARWLLALGLGPRDGFDAESCTAFGRDAVARALRLRVSTLALGMPSSRTGDLAASTLLEALLAGAIAALAEKSHDIRMCIVSPTGEVARTRKALAALIPRLRPAPVALQMEDLPILGRTRPSPQGEPGSSVQSRQSIK
jgi:hypothetical protein